MKLFHPERFQGSLSKNRYFEGWYYKTVSGGESFAFIPGISLGEDSHAFIQCIDGKSHDTVYLRFPLSDFHSDQGRLDIRIGKNRFTKDKLILDEKRDGFTLAGELRFSGLTPFPRRLFSPGIMGPFGYLPFMECYHGVVSLDHRVDGALEFNRRQISVEDGRGYIEKDWGRSMPSSWIWIQSNVFDTPGVSVMLSVARIPFLGTSFTGHLGFMLHEGRVYRFGTYLGSRVSIDEADQRRLSMQVRSRRHVLSLRVEADQEGGSLAAPVNGGMERSIRERTDARIAVELSDARGRRIFGGGGAFCGIEVVGNLDEMGSLLSSPLRSGDFSS